MKIVVFGASEIGYLIATEFFEDHDITIIDKEENKTAALSKLDISYIEGNGSNINTLKFLLPVRSLMRQILLPALP